MPRLTTVLKLEISRLAAKEVRRIARPLGRIKKQMKALRLTHHAQRRALASIEKRVLRLRSRALGSVPGSSGRGGVSAESIRALRARLGMTRKQFAAVLGVSPGSIFGWETGRTVPRGKSLERLAEIRKKGVRAVRSQAATAPQVRGHRPKTARPGRGRGGQRPKAA